MDVEEKIRFAWNANKGTRTHHAVWSRGSQQVAELLRTFAYANALPVHLLRQVSGGVSGGGFFRDFVDMSDWRSVGRSVCQLVMKQRIF